MIINYTEEVGFFPMSVIIFFSASKQLFFCRNDVQAIDFLRKGSYAPDSKCHKIKFDDMTKGHLSRKNTLIY
jgi:hypothetical protein